MKIARSIECPYCKVKVVYRMDLESLCEVEKILTCDTEEGGCDKKFIVKLKLSLDFEVGRIIYK